MGHHHHTVPCQLAVQLQEVGSLSDSAVGEQGRVGTGQGQVAGVGGLGEGGAQYAGCACALRSSGALGSQRHPLALCNAQVARPYPAARQVHSLLYGFHGVLQLLPRSCGAAAVGRRGLASLLPPPTPLHASSPQSAQVEWPPPLHSTSGATTPLFSYLGLCPLPTIRSLRTTPLCCPPWHLAYPSTPPSSLPPRWATRRAQKAGAQGVCSRRGRRRKKMDSMT